MKTVVLDTMIPILIYDRKLSRFLYICPYFYMATYVLHIDLADFSPFLWLISFEWSSRVRKDNGDKL